MLKRRGRLWALLLSLALIITCMPVLAFADDSPIDFYEVTENLSGSYMFELNKLDYIGVNSTNDLVSAVSSEESIIQIRQLHNVGDGSWELEVDPVGVGEATITVKDSAGNTGSCIVEVKTGIFFYSKDEVSVSVSGGDTYLYVHADDLSASNFEISDEEVASVRTVWSLGAGRCGCGLDLHKCGETTITVHDGDGRTASVKLTVTEADWELNTNSLEFQLSDGYEAWDALKVVLGKDYPDLQAESSDESVVTASMDGYEVALELQGAGEADITVSDNYGKSRVCHVIVNPDPPTPFDFTEKSCYFAFEPQSGTFDPAEYTFYRIDECMTAITDYRIDTDGVVDVELANEGSDGKFYELTVRPCGVGEAVITAIDEQGLEADIKVTVAEELFLDQSYFGSTNASSPGSFNSKAIYGDTKLECHCNYDGTVASYTSGGTTYKGTIKDGKCVLKIPRITSKTVSVKFTNGNSKYTAKATVSKKKAAYVKATAANVTYTGKALKPKVTVKDGSYTLKKDTDYTVTYKNNTKVGNGTATIRLKGNYTGTKTATFKVLPKGTSISSLTPAKRSFTVKWNRNSAVNGYDIEYSNLKSFSNVATAKEKDALTIRYTRNTVTSRTFTGLVSGRTYYVRVRTYKTVSGKKFYSKWSAVKTVKVK